VWWLISWEAERGVFLPEASKCEGGRGREVNRNTRRWTGGLTQTVKHLPYKHKALSSSLGTTRGKKNKQKYKEKVVPGKVIHMEITIMSHLFKYGPQ
jgi:hypothetical protein